MCVTFDRTFDILQGIYSRVHVIKIMIGGHQICFFNNKVAIMSSQIRKHWKWDKCIMFSFRLSLLPFTILHMNSIQVLNFTYGIVDYHDSYQIWLLLWCWLKHIVLWKIMFKKVLYSLFGYIASIICGRCFCVQK